MKHLVLLLAILTLSMMIPHARCQQPTAREAEASPASAGASALPKAKEAPPVPRLASEDTAPAEAPVSPEEDKPAVAGQDDALTLTKIFERGGWVMYVIAALSFVALALIIFYILTLRAQVLFPEDFILDAEDAAVNGDWDGLQALCHNNSSPAARIIEASLEQIVPGQPWNYDRIQAAMEDEGARQAGFLWQRLQYLMDVAIIAPMVGLLGTVWGMMLSFAGIENGADFASKAETMASGIAQAMYTTFGGLIVGILAMAIYDLIRGHLNRIISAMERACGTVLRKLTPPSGGMSPVRK